VKIFMIESPNWLFQWWRFQAHPTLKCSRNYAMDVLGSLLGVFYRLSRETEQMSQQNLHASQ
jgi:hypothetical protein